MTTTSLREQTNGVIEEYADKLVELFKQYELILDEKPHKDPVVIMGDLMAVDKRLQDSLATSID
jgi:hypothetical protein